MFLQKNTANRIIKEISTVLNYDINIMNEKGIIIASTNHDRIDCFHEGAYKIIHESLDELLVYHDDEYEGCRKGINLPILMDKTIIGVIGMTGEVDELMKYGHIIKKMTEIMLLDIFYIHQQSIDEQKKMVLLHDIINGTDDTCSTEKQLKKYGFNNDDKFTALIFEPSELFERFVSSGILSANLGDFGAALTQINKEKLHSIISSVSKTDIAARFYISDSQYTVSNLHQLFNNAERVMDYSKHMISLESEHILYYDDYIIDIVISGISSDNKSKCINKIFAGCTESEISSFADFIRSYCYYNGSIKKIADAMYIHKNTVQYKINKIQSRTGLDPRNSEDLFRLMLAVKFIDK